MEHLNCQCCQIAYKTKQIVKKVTLCKLYLVQNISFFVTPISKVAITT